MLLKTTEMVIKKINPKTRENTAPNINHWIESWNKEKKLDIEEEPLSQEYNDLNESVKITVTLQEDVTMTPGFQCAT